MRKTSLKVDMMVNYAIENNRDYKIMPRSIIKNHVKTKFRCSDYMANQVIKKLFEDETDNKA